jgi:hypothetical protein
MSQSRPFAHLDTDLISAMIGVQKTNLDQLDRKRATSWAVPRSEATLNYEAQAQAEMESVLACAYAELRSRAQNLMEQEMTPKPQWMADAETDPLVVLLSGPATSDVPMTAGPNPIPVHELLNSETPYEQLSGFIGMGEYQARWGQ